MNEKVRVRMAPSPTGLLHIGSLRTALYDFLIARKNSGTFVLRIEDTDQNRLVPGAIENIIQTLSDFSLTPDEGFILEDGKIKEVGDYGPYLQSKRLDIYHRYAQELLSKKKAYHCFCTSQRLEDLRKQQEAQKLPPRYDKFCLKLSEEEIQAKLAAGESSVIRLNVEPGHMVAFDDLVFGHIEISTSEIDDQVLIKSDGFPTYPMAVVIDDHLMEITHITRGDEFISSTPKHILLYEAFGWEIPKFVHFPPVLSKATKKKLSKREGDVSVQSFLDKGYLKPAILNFLAFLGWSPKSEQEIFSLLELVQEFSIDRLHKAGAIFDLDKLDWFNSTYIRNLKIEELFALTLHYLTQAGFETEKYPKAFLEKILSLEQSRLTKLSEIGERVTYFFRQPEYEASLLIWKKSEPKTIQTNLLKLSEYLKTGDASEAAIKQFIEEHQLKTGEVLWPLRAALSGLAASPGPFEIMETFLILPDGREIILDRINQALQKISTVI
jgi:glutamyl-tRNA synthetase